MMLLYENFRLALSSLKANKMRSLLTMLGIIIGIASVIAIMTVGESLSGSLSSTMEGMGANNMEVYLDYRPDYEGEYYIEEEDLLKPEQVKAMCKAMEGKIKAVSVERSVGSTEVVKGNKKAKVNISGNSAGYYMINNVKLLRGRYFKESENTTAAKVCIVSDKYVDVMYGGRTKDAIGQTETVEYDGKTYRFTIVGVYEYHDVFAGMGMSSGENVTTDMYIPYQTAVNITHADYITWFKVMGEQGIEQEALMEEMKQFFEREYYSNNEKIHVDCYSMSTMVEEAQSMLGTVTVGISFIAGIALLVGGIGVMNIMLVSITERTREIGTRKALGAPNGSIRTQFIVESIVICVIGGIIGIILGCVLGMGAAALMNAGVAPSVKGIVISLSFSMAIGLFFGFYPANKAAKLDPIEALRYE